MNRVALKRLPLRTNRWEKWSRVLPRIFFGLFMLQYALVCYRVLSSKPLLENARWPDGVLVVLATATLLVSQAQHLPAQNVMLAGILIATMGGAIHTIGALSGVPFGPFRFTDRIGQELFHPLPWAIPMVWLILILSSRGVARLIMRPGRTHRHYGLWVMGLTTFLVVILTILLEPFATQLKHFWRWDVSRTSVDWYSAPWVSFVGWTVSTVLILAFVTPCLINKKPGKPPPADFYPAIIWLLLNLLFTAGALKLKLWPAASIGLATTLLVLCLSLYGAKSREPAPGLS